MKNWTFVGLCIVIYFYSKTKPDVQYLKFILKQHSTCFGWSLRLSSGVFKTVHTASGICHTGPMAVC